MLIKLNGSIRKQAYRFFLIAEHFFEGDDVGDRKMEYVLDHVYPYLPKILQIFISPELLQKIIQKMFDEIKDLLDDGKRNNSIGDEDYE